MADRHNPEALLLTCPWEWFLSCAGPEETLDLITTDNGVSHKGSICWAEGVGNIEERWTEMSTVLWILTLKSAYLVAKQLW